MRSATAVTLAALAAVVAGAGAGGCGGVGVEAPHTIGANEDTGCPSADDALAHTKAALDSPSLHALRPVLTRVLVDEGGLRVLLRAASVILDNTDATAFRRLFSGLDPQNGLGDLTPHVVDVLRYVDGSSPYVPGAHPEPVAALHAVFSQCDAAQTVAVLRALLQLEVTTGPDGKLVLAAGGTGDQAWLSAVLDAAQVALDDPEVLAVLQQIQLDDGQGERGSIHIGKDAFELVAKLLAANLSAPDFDPAYTRTLLDDVIVSRVNGDDARAKVDHLLDVILLITDPAADVFPDTQIAMACVNHADSDAALPGMIYDWLTIPELSVDTFLTDVTGAAGGEGGGDLRLAVVDLMGALEPEPDLARDSAAVFAKLIDADAAPAGVKALLDLQGKGVVAEVAHLKDAVASCHAADFAP